MTARVHGGYRGPAPAGGVRAVIDFSANLNPYGPPARVLEGFRDADVSRYPDPEYTNLRSRLAERLGVEARHVGIGNGSAEILFCLARAFVRPGDAALALAPAFGDYTAALAAAGAGIVEEHASEASGFVWEPDAVIGAIERARPRLLFVGQPNNPTGVMLERDSVRRWAAAMPQGLVVLDEAFIDFVEDPWCSVGMAPNVATLRSFTKMFTIPGLRAGYLVASTAVVEAVAAQQPTWSVGAPALAAAEACLDEDAFVTESRARLTAERRRFVEGLRALGVPLIEGAANFVLVSVGDAAGATARLIERGFAVRDCTSFGLPEHVRIAVRTPDENAALLDAMAQVLRAR